MDISFYWATFSYDYINTIHNKGLHKWDPQKKIKIHHLCPWSLIKKDEWAQAIKEFVAMVKFVMDGKASIGYLHQDLAPEVIMGVGDETGMMVEEEAETEVKGSSHKFTFYNEMFESLLYVFNTKGGNDALEADDEDYTFGLDGEWTDVEQEK